MKLHVEFLIHYVKVWYQAVVVKLQTAGMHIVLNSLCFLKHLLERFCLKFGQSGWLL